jgi:pimeloyl-ACP methyl ester carboxylesterase
LPEQKPGIVLVHGVWSDGSIWREVITLLAHQGYRVRAAQIPLTSFAEDVAFATRTIDHAEGPVVLVGHSYGGGVISDAGHHSKVENLVYIAALASLPEEPLGAVLGRRPPAVHVEMQPDQNGFIWATTDQFREALAHDAPRGAVNLAITVQKPFHPGIFGASIAKPAWQSKPSWYLIATEDRILSPETQHELAAAIHAEKREVASSHIPMLSNPEAVARIIAEAAEA